MNINIGDIVHLKNCENNTKGNRVTKFGIIIYFTDSKIWCFYINSKNINYQYSIEIDRKSQNQDTHYVSCSKVFIHEKIDITHKSGNLGLDDLKRLQLHILFDDDRITYSPRDKNIIKNCLDSEIIKYSND